MCNRQHSICWSVEDDGNVSTDGSTKGKTTELLLFLKPNGKYAWNITTEIPVMEKLDRYLNPTTDQSDKRPIMILMIPTGEFEWQIEKLILNCMGSQIWNTGPTQIIKPKTHIGEAYDPSM